jgi:hypothetical protein
MNFIKTYILFITESLITSLKMDLLPCSNLNDVTSDDLQMCFIILKHEIERLNLFSSKRQLTIEENQRVKEVTDLLQFIDIEIPKKIKYERMVIKEERFRRSMEEGPKLKEQMEILKKEIVKHEIIIVKLREEQACIKKELDSFCQHTDTENCGYFEICNDCGKEC